MVLTGAQRSAYTNDNGTHVQAQLPGERARTYIHRTERYRTA